MLTLNEALKFAGLPLKEEYDPQKTSVEAQKLIKLLKGQFHVPIDDTTNKDGSVTIKINNGHGALDSEARGNPGIVSPKNISAAIDKTYQDFRTKGWYFSQPVRGEFTIGVK